MITAKNITKIYKTGVIETHALRNVSFAVEEGEFVAIMGPSGSGKSTLMHIIGVLDNPTSGEYFLDGKNISKLSEKDLADIRKDKIGFVFQSFNLLPRATVLRNVMLPLVYANVDKEERRKIAEKALLDVGLSEDHWLHRSNEISGGQMQRVAIARALVNNPSLILADEPTGNLDTQTGEMVMKTFQQLNIKEKHTIVLITHDQNVANHAKRIIEIRDGVIQKDQKNKKQIIIK
ncbi:ABC transporter ATP-binding protein [Candidatus Gracilibacteria bacterium]|nr:ABC transporter ATP-binding protein [Candidatus Gracilibacteria bacterium]